MKPRGHTSGDKPLPAAVPTGPAPGAVRQGDRTLVNVRLRNTGLAVIDRLATGEGVTRSEMIRRLLAEAVTARRTS